MITDKLIQKVMTWWAKITSWAVVYFVLSSLYLAFKFIPLYFESEALYNVEISPYRIMSLGSATISVVGLIVNSIFAVWLMFPFFYYGWFKRTDDKNAKTSTKIIAAFISLWIVLIPILQGVTVVSILTIFIGFLIVIPLYYFGWVK